MSDRLSQLWEEDENWLRLASAIETEERENPGADPTTIEDLAIARLRTEDVRILPGAPNEIRCLDKYLKS